MKINKKNLYYLILLLNIICLILMNGCGSKGNGVTEKISENDEKIDASLDKKTDSSGSSQETHESETEEITSGENIGSFTMEDMEGNSYTQEMFADYDITLVNIFTTWCSPCVNEIPDLEKLKNEMSDQGVNVVGIALDTVDEAGNVSDEVIEKAKLLAERTGASYPFLIPDKSNMNGRLSNIFAVPETFFVDKEGNIVGETYTGSRSLEDWEKIVETVRKGVVQ